MSELSELLKMASDLTERDIDSLLDEEDHAHMTEHGQTIGAIQSDGGFLIQPDGTTEIGGRGALITAHPRSGSLGISADETQLYGSLRLFPATPTTSFEINGGVLNPAVAPGRDAGQSWPSRFIAVVKATLGKIVRRPWVAMLQHTHASPGSPAVWGQPDMTAQTEVRDLDYQPLFAQSTTIRGAQAHLPREET